MLKRELEWVRMSPKAQATKNKARLQRYEELSSQEYDARDDAPDIQIPVTRPLGELVVRAEKLTKASLFSKYAGPNCGLSLMTASASANASCFLPALKRTTPMM